MSQRRMRSDEGSAFKEKPTGGRGDAETGGSVSLDVRFALSVIELGSLVKSIENASLVAVSGTRISSRVGKGGLPPLNLLHTQVESLAHKRG